MTRPSSFHNERFGPWPTIDDVELATPIWVDGWNTRRLHGAIGHQPPAALETAYYRHNQTADEAITY